MRDRNGVAGHGVGWNLHIDQKIIEGFISGEFALGSGVLRRLSIQPGFRNLDLDQIFKTCVDCGKIHLDNIVTLVA